jgi:hypothetical protein
VLIDEGKLSPVACHPPWPVACVQCVSSLTNQCFSDARRYFKQSEIVLYRQTPEIAAAAANAPTEVAPQPAAAPIEQQRTHGTAVAG